MTTIQLVMLIILCILLVQWPLAMIGLLQLYQAKLPKKQFWVWNIVCLTCIVIGPVSFFIFNVKRKKKAARTNSGDDYCI